MSCSIADRIAHAHVDKSSLPYASARLKPMHGNLSGWHLIILAVIWIIPFVVTVVSIARNRVASGTAKAVWVLIALLVPWIGLILWFTIGRTPAPAD
ncbi:hypothetical protein GCM10010460_20010 [Microbacterium terrae]|uniref:Cardiolipin synthase N-terminal domain-containing protein n=2 Tax=Microbacterium terrae TaxID=69369 RepID=A0A0M2H6X3_9MICO|nr:hypothetical protein RS81_01262 [Microbacterium terrae]GLJ97462.1 hypothetical protein GCM10017594_06590 [Microbacterium terrae]